MGRLETGISALPSLFGEHVERPGGFWFPFLLRPPPRPQRGEGIPLGQGTKICTSVLIGLDWGNHLIPRGSVEVGHFFLFLLFPT